MPYTAPTAEEFKARFSPTFDGVSDPRVEAVIPDAGRYVDESWPEVDYQPAYLQVMAHILISEGVLNSSNAPLAGLNTGAVTQEALGDASVSYASNSGGGSGSSQSQFATTIYGRQYLAMLKRVHGGFRTLNAS